jgi:hypothetical protein
MDWDSVWQNLAIGPKPTDVYTSGYDTSFSISFPFTPETDYRGDGRRDGARPLWRDDRAGAVVSFHRLAAAVAGAGRRVSDRRLQRLRAGARARTTCQCAEIDYRLYRIDAAATTTPLIGYNTWQASSPPMPRCSSATACC